MLIRNKFAGINFIDTYHRSGLYARDLPFIGGQEGGGYIAALSDEAKAMVNSTTCECAASVLIMFDVLDISRDL